MRQTIKPSTRADLVRLGAELKRQRLKAGLTQEQLAERLQRDHSYIGKIERAEQVLDVAMLFDIVEAIGADIHEVIRAVLEDA